MSRSRHSQRSTLKASPSHKRLRTAVHQALGHELTRVRSASLSGQWREVLADSLEELGDLEKADALRNAELELPLPRAPHGWNTRLRW